MSRLTSSCSAFEREFVLEVIGGQWRAAKSYLLFLCGHLGLCWHLKFLGFSLLEIGEVIQALLRGVHLLELLGWLDDHRFVEQSEIIILLLELLGLL